MTQNSFAARHILFFITALILSGTGQEGAYGSATDQTGTVSDHRQEIASPHIYGFKIIRSYPHDRYAFTQGLAFHEGYIYEGTGLYGSSTLRKVALDTGEVIQRHALPSQLFGEGITILQNMVIQLTWRSHAGFVYALDSFSLIRGFEYPTEGWGITYDGKQLVMSDGTEYLYFLNPESYEVSGKIRVYDEKGFITRLNELEFVNGLIYANVWRTSRIAMIDPISGQVKGWIELQGLVEIAGGDNVTKTLNGIAYDDTSDRLLVTGKMWPHIYEIRLVLPGD